MEEAALVRRALDRGSLAARVEAVRVRGDAAGVAAPLLDNPVLEARHEQARGPAGATTEFIGGTVTLGVSGVVERQASRLRGRAAGAWTRAEVVSAICDVRRGALELWLASEQAGAAGAAHERLQGLLAGLGDLARAGEVAAYDRDRLAVSVAAHQHAVDLARARHHAARASLAADVGHPVDRVQLLPLVPTEAHVQTTTGALAADPELQALRSEREAALRGLAAARWAALPSLSVSGGARWDALPDGSARTPGFEFGAGLSLPLFDRNQVERGARRAALAELDARIAEHQATLDASTDAAQRQLSALGSPPSPLPTTSLWQGALDRFAAGESTIDELLTVAGDIEAAELAAPAGVALRRAAGLELSCTVGVFPEPDIQALLEEQIQ